MGSVYSNPADQVERAVQSLLVNMGLGTLDATYLFNDGRVRCQAQNRTLLAESVRGQRPYRPEWVVHLQIQHWFPGVQQVQPLQNDQGVDVSPWTGNDRVNFNAFIGATVDLLGYDTDQAMTNVCANITAAGRWLAQTDGTPVGAQIAAANADMANFRVDWVKQGEPFITRGKPEGHTDSNSWAEVVHFEVGGSYSAV
jgi:hypothetical protein